MVTPKIKKQHFLKYYQNGSLPFRSESSDWKCGGTGKGEATLQFPMKFKNRNRKELVSPKDKEERLQWSMHKCHQTPHQRRRKWEGDARGRETGMECEGKTTPCSPTQWLTKSPPGFKEIRQTKAECRVMGNTAGTANNRQVRGQELCKGLGSSLTRDELGGEDRTASQEACWCFVREPRKLDRCMTLLKSLRECENLKY